MILTLFLAADTVWGVRWALCLEMEDHITLIYLMLSDNKKIEMLHFNLSFISLIYFTY